MKCSIFARRIHANDLENVRVHEQTGKMTRISRIQTMIGETGERQTVLLPKC